MKKNRLQFWKNWSIRFRFYKPETKKTKPNPTRKKPSQTGKKISQNRFEPVFVLKNQIELNRNQSGFFKKQISVWLLFLIKTESNRKWSPLLSVLRIFPTLALVNIAQIQKIRYSWLWRQWIFSQKMNLKKKFSMSFFLVYPLLLFVLFRRK